MNFASGLTGVGQFGGESLRLEVHHPGAVVAQVSDAVLDLDQLDFAAGGARAEPATSRVQASVLEATKVARAGPR